MQKAGKILIESWFIMIYQEKKEINYPYLQKPVEVYTMPSGHTIVLAYKEGGLVNISTWVKTGSINENDEINGISHFLEHLMFKGTTKHKAGEFDKTLEAYGAIVNAATWKDYTFYYVTLPKGPEDKYFNEAIELHADMMLDPILPEDELGEPFVFGKEEPTQKRERLVVIEEIRMRKDQPSTRVYNALNHSMYTNHPYKRDVIGTPEIISAVPQSVVMDYYKKFYTPNNMTTIVVGEFDSEKVLEKVVKEFDFKGRENCVLPVHEIDAPHKETKYIELKGQLNTAFLMFGYLGPKANDLKNSVALDIVNIVLGDGSSSRLYQRLIEQADENIFNHVDSEFYQFKDGGNFFVDANFEPEYKDKAIELIKKEIQQILDEGITEEELAKAKKKLKVAYASTSETVSEIADNIGFYMTVLGNLEQANEYLEIVQGITVNEVLEIARNYLTLNKATIAVMLPE